MIRELAILDVKVGLESDFEVAFSEAEKLISRQQGYQSHSLEKCVEKANRYLLLVEWESLEDHTEGFRGSDDYVQWRELLHHFYDPFPAVEHYSGL